MNKDKNILELSELETMSPSEARKIIRKTKGFTPKVTNINEYGRKVHYCSELKEKFDRLTGK